MVDSCQEITRRCLQGTGNRTESTQQDGLAHLLVLSSTIFQRIGTCSLLCFDMLSWCHPCLICLCLCYQAICSKIPYLAEDAKRMVAKGCCVLFGLQSTGDASMQSILEQNKDTERFPALLSTVAAVMTNFISSHFPVAPGRPEVPKVSELPSFASVEEQRRYLLLKREAERIQNMPDPQPLPELVATRQNLLNRIQTIQLPPNPLDDLIDRLGGVNNVSEMTGRPGRMVRSKNRFLYAKRGVEIDANDRINLVEKRKFMDGKKSYAIISDAASTGISLHAAQGSLSSHKRRIHYTIELPWSADKAVVSAFWAVIVSKIPLLT